ncbi:hypothetical protein C7A07_16985 [Pseudomonas fragi]|nr:hypothetical protein C7A07_16985 [Pseudomonas fragi]
MCAHRSTCGSRLACDANTAVCLLNRRDAIAGKPAPTMAGGELQIMCAPHYLWELACLRCKHCGLSVKPQGCHRGQARSHKGWGGIADCARTALPVGAGLPAMQTLRSVC